jgi:hypothetical protein
VGSYGLTWALKNPSRVSKLVALNTPLTTSTPLPGIFQQLRLVLFPGYTVIESGVRVFFHAISFLVYQL